MVKTLASIYSSNIEGAYDSRPDYKRTIYMDVVDTNDGKATNIYQIIGDGWLSWQGLVGADQDIIICAAPCAEAIYTNLKPHQFDRIIIGGDHGDGTDQGSGSIYICGDHTWFVYGQGNDKLNWRMSFTPSKSNNLPADQLVHIVPHGVVTVFNAYPAYGKLENCIRRVSGYQIDFDNLGTIVQNNPLNFTKFPEHIGMNRLVKQDSTSFTERPYIHQVTIPAVSNKRYVLTGFTTTTVAGTDGITRRLNRYWYCNGNAYTTTHNAWNEHRVASYDGLAATALKGNNLLLIENVVTPATGVVQSSKWRAVYQHNWLERAYTDRGGSYSRVYRQSVASKMTVTMYRAVRVGDEGKWIRYNDTTMWRIDSVEPGTTSGVTFTYTPFTFSGSATGYSVTEETPVTISNNSTVRHIYIHDAVDNPHPYTYIFPNRWTFKASGCLVDVDGNKFYTWSWGFRHHWCAISPTVEWNSNTDLTRNTENVVGPSAFVENLNFSGTWQLLHTVCGDKDGSYLDDNTRFETVTSGDMAGFRILKPLSDTDPVVRGEELTNVTVNFRMHSNSANTAITNGWGSHPLEATILPEGGDDDSDTTVDQGGTDTPVDPDAPTNPETPTDPATPETPEDPDAPPPVNTDPDSSGLENGTEPDPDVTTEG